MSATRRKEQKIHPEVLRIAPILRSGAWFGALPAALQEQLLGLAQPRRLDPGQLLFAAGDAPDGLWCVAEGTMRISSVSAEGKEAIAAIMESPNWFGEIAVFDGLPRTHHARAEHASLLLHVPQAAMHALLAREPAWWRELGLLLTHKLRVTFATMEETALLPAAGRLARRLVLIAEGYGQRRDASRRMIELPQEQLAMMLALSRQTVNQILKQFEGEGAVRLSRGGIEILDLELLRRLAA